MHRNNVVEVRSVAAFVLAVALGLAVNADGRTIRVDAGSDGFPDSGQSWPIDIPLGSAPFLSGTLAFGINFGNGIQTDFCLFEDGVIGFATDCTAIPADARLEPLAADWISDPTATRIFHDASVTYSPGHLDRGAPPFPDEPNDATPRAARFTWNDVICADCAGQPTYSFQAILIQVGTAGDFDLELNYDNIPAGVGIAGFTLGSNQFGPFPGPFLSAVDNDFQFRNGVLVDGNGTAVPEPGALWLLVLAAAAMVTSRKRRLAVPS